MGRECCSCVQVDPRIDRWEVKRRSLFPVHNKEYQRRCRKKTGGTLKRSVNGRNNANLPYRDERAPVQWQKYGLRALLPGVGSPVGSKWNQRWLLARNVVVRL